MSKKSFFKGFKKASLLPEARPLRTIEEVKKDYADEMGKLATAQYLVFVHTQTANECNKKLVSINQEFHALNEAEKAKQAAASQETKNG